jgi:hypothetical protein
VAVLVELLAAEGAVAGDQNDHTYGLLTYFCLFWDAFFCWVIAMAFSCRWHGRLDVSYGKRLACTFAALARAALPCMDEISIQPSLRMTWLLAEVVVANHLMRLADMDPQDMPIGRSTCGIGYDAIPALHNRHQWSQRFVFSTEVW